MKILFVCHRFPYPPNEGGKIRAFNMIAHLHRNHEVTVASLTESSHEREAVAGIAPYCSEYFSEHLLQPLAWLKSDSTSGFQRAFFDGVFSFMETAKAYPANC